MVVGHPVHMTGCGRTDAGVHARVYVANFRTSSTHPGGPAALCAEHPPALRHRGDRSAFEVHEDFNAIGSCVRKEYTYQIYNSRHQGSVLCQPCMVLPQALGRERDAGGGEPVRGNPRFCRRTLASARMSNPPSARYTITMWSGGGELSLSARLRQRFPLQHGAGHGGDGGLRRRGKDTARRRSAKFWPLATAPPQARQSRREGCT